VASVQALKAAITRKNPGAWNSVVRQHAENIIAEATSETAGGVLKNSPDKIFKDLLSGKKGDLLFAAVDPATRKTLAHFKKVLSAASTGRAARIGELGTGEASERLAGSGLKRLVGNFLGGVVRSSMSALSFSLRSIRSESIGRLRARALADIIFNPRWAGRVKSAMRKRPGTTTEYRAWLQLFRDGEDTITREMTVDSVEAPNKTPAAQNFNAQTTSAESP